LLIFEVLDQDLFLDDDAIGVGRIEDINMYDKSKIGVGRKKELIDLQNPKAEKVGILDVDIWIENKCLTIFIHSIFLILIYSWFMFFHSS
jgi:hypothetical protein